MADPRALRLLILTPDYPMWDGGVCVWAEKLARFWARQGHEVTVATPHQLPEDLEYDNSQSHRVLRWRNVKDRYQKYFYAHYKVRGLLRRQSFDHIVSTTWHPFANAALRHAPDTPLTLMAHGNDFMEARWQGSFWRPRMGNAFRQAHRIIAVSSETQNALNQFLSVRKASTHVVFPAVDPDEFQVAPFPAQPPVLLTLGRVVKRKGQDMVLRALPAILNEFPDTQYWVAGRGADLDRLKKLTTKNGLENSVRFLGFVSEDERLRLYEQCSVYLMPSRTIGDEGDFEGFGITYLEANACGRPTIGGRSGGVADAVLDGETGFLVDPESPEDIAEKTLRLLRDPKLAQRLGQKGRARVENELNWDATAKRMIALMERK